MGRLALTGVLSILACVETVDLRTHPPGDPLGADAQAGDLERPCASGERVDPDTGFCEPCRVDAHPFFVCPCGWAYHEAPFPWCEGTTASYDCDDGCAGDITVCNAARSPDADGTVRDCGQLRDCCDRLAQDPDSNACCPHTESLLCEARGGGFWPNGYSCLSNACCETPCAEDAECDTTFQVCEGNRCVPGCDPDSSACVDEGSCRCVSFP